ncbi:hypothetical protein GCK72_012396 [Caenorhabditis remanei]|uniref:Uncharacterized protein n=1 Tax=Caenorhabditis remanei TaxID=31234 RepID=A0A6A5GMS2_CAERE|nr:hypothetical protein GCK72_012396 [Caenorhabditis remanei]KAF1755943.1 hypothetical protein GCK72_012396 [Caenorhabditis remanei]
MRNLLCNLGLLLSIYGIALADDEQPRYFASTGDDAAKDQKFGALFIQTMRNVIKEPCEVIGILFQPNFVIVGCNGTYSKGGLIEIITIINNLISEKLIQYLELP